VSSVVKRKQKKERSTLRPYILFKIQAQRYIEKSVLICGICGEKENIHK
jgi:hypothetical protein